MAHPRDPARLSQESALTSTVFASLDRSDASEDEHSFLALVFLAYFQV